jgi:hypothetical protein
MVPDKVLDRRPQDRWRGIPIRAGWPAVSFGLTNATSSDRIALGSLDGSRSLAVRKVNGRISPSALTVGSKFGVANKNSEVAGVPT